MKRIALLIPILATLVAAPAAHAARPRVAVTTCDRTHRAAVFEGRMNALPRSQRMQMRFRLQISTPDEPDWTRLNVPGFSSWVTSETARTRYVYAKRVEALAAPAGYRVQVKFRWLDANGDTVRVARVTSRACRQPDPRADLRVVDLRLAPAARNRYDVTLRNSGHTDAPASTVDLALPDGTTLSGDVPPMAPGDREDVFLSGPACSPGDVLTATADATDVIDERDEANTFGFACPAA
jgi:CARDB